MLIFKRILFIIVAISVFGSLIVPDATDKVIFVVLAAILCSLAFILRMARDPLKALACVALTFFIASFSTYRISAAVSANFGIAAVITLCIILILWLFAEILQMRR